MPRNPKNDLYTTVTAKEKEAILTLIENQIYLNIPDFVRQAVREKLAKHGE